MKNTEANRKNEIRKKISEYKSLRCVVFAKIFDVLAFEWSILTHADERLKHWLSNSLIKLLW